MQKLTVSIPAEKVSYPLFIGKNLVENIKNLFDLKKYSSIFIISDTKVAPLFSKKILSVLNSKILLLEPGENAKNITNVEKIWKFLKDAGADRKSLQINLGGGSLTDMAGFAASTYMRGIDFIQIPTTLLSMVDASVGGKVGIDFDTVKNLIGSFNQPVGVIIDINTLKSLPEREFNAGFAEIIKHGLIYNKNYFNLVISKKPDEFSDTELEKIIYTSLKIKSEIVSKDEKESSNRKLLNFGHTIGHAIESISLQTKSPLLHGEAISIGIILESKISELVGNINNTEYQQIKNALINAGLPYIYEKININEILEKIKNDKKSEKGTIKWTLLKKIGQAIINQDVSQSEIIKAFKKVYGFTN